MSNLLSEDDLMLSVCYPQIMKRKSIVHNLYIFILLLILIPFFQNCDHSPSIATSNSNNNRIIKNENNGGGEIYPGPGLQVVSFQVTKLVCPDGFASDAIYQLTNLQTNEIKYTYFRKDCEPISKDLDTISFQWIEENEKFYYENKLFVKILMESTSPLAK